jgi:integrating conjugative element protein (TIGR03752 family)
MAQKRIANKWLLIIVGFTLVSLVLMVSSDSKEEYTSMTQLPALDHGSQPQDGDTQADTIKALQAYAKAAVDKAERLHDYSRSQSKQIAEHNGQLHSLESEYHALQEDLKASTQRFTVLEGDLQRLKQSLKTAKKSNNTTGKQIATHRDIPVGFGFDELTQGTQSELFPHGNPNKGAWHNSIDSTVNDGKGNDQGRFSGLLSPSKRLINNKESTQKPQKKKSVIEPMYTLAKDAVLTDAIAMTALIGRIPINGKTPDPYPVKLFIGRENLLANGHDLPEIEGMIFSGLAIGDWNLSCVSARLYSASYIFTDGTIVNHSTTGDPLGYISDPAGIPCVSGQFVTNAPQFLLKRAGLAGLGVAGAAYAEAQQQKQTSSLTGNTTRTVLGDIDKLVAGEMVQSVTDEVTQWLLERQKQSFDAVVVNPGVAVAVHLDKELVIDHNNQARKVRYGGNHENLHRVMD